MTINGPDDLGAPPPGDLPDKLRQAIEGGGDSDDLRIRLEVHGGQRAERYDFKLELTRRGVDALELRDELRGERIEGLSRGVEQANVDEVLSLVNVDELLAAADQTPQFPPDSLVGRLILSVGGREVPILFAADEEQAKTAGIETPRAVAQLVDALYGIAERSTDRRGLRP